MQARLFGVPTRMAALGLVALVASGAGCAGDAGDGAEIPRSTLEPALASIDAGDLMSHIDVLASDRFGGRAPGTVGEDSTVAYLTERFRALGLEPGNPDGGYVQHVPLVGITSTPVARFRAGSQTLEPDYPADYVAVTRRVVPEIGVEGSEMVFVGYGVRAPEYGWDDFKGMDLAGKTLVVLINDPPVPDPEDPELLDESMFGGRAMTYYGRWSYKYEIGAELGADAVVIIHETDPAGYPYAVVSGSWGGENFDIETDAAKLPVEAWVTSATAEALLAAAGHDLDALKEAALSPGFEPVPLGATADFHIENEVRRVESRNVLARLPGADAPDEHIVYTAHWDHLGTDPGLEGDQIYNGALDNATGTAGLLELAEAFTALPEPPARSVLFLAVTAEEQGLLGAKFYATSPLYPLERTLANINIDGLNQWGRTEDIVVIGLGNSTLDDVLRRAAEAQGRTLEPDPEPEKGFFYRSDHFEFAKQGVPALYTDAGTRYIGKPEGYGEEKRAEYTAEDYHKPSDEIKPDWDLAGAVDDLRLLFEVGYRVAEADAWPRWNEGTEFKALREERLEAAGIEPGG